MQEIELSRRERQIMDVLYQHGSASVAQVMESLSEPPSYSAVRTLLGILEGKGHVTHEKQGRRYLYRAVRPRQKAGHSALKRVLQTFYDNSVEKAVAALLDVTSTEITDAELDRLTQMIEQSRKEGIKP